MKVFVVEGKRGFCQETTIVYSSHSNMMNLCVLANEETVSSIENLLLFFLLIVTVI